MTEDDLKAIEARCNAATEGPWNGSVHDYSAADIHSTTKYMGDMSPVLVVGPCGACAGREKKRAEKENRKPEWKWGRCTTPSKEDFDFVVQARQDIPALIAELRKAWEEIEIMSRERKAIDESWAKAERKVLENETRGLEERFSRND